MKKISLLTAALLFLIISACQSTAASTGSTDEGVIGTQVKVEGGTYTDLTASELNSIMDKKDFLLVNVHIPFIGNIPKTDRSIPYDTITQNLDKLPADKSASIVLYCSSGHMSSIAARELVKLGYIHVSELAGGMAAWQQAGFTVER